MIVFQSQFGDIAPSEFSITERIFAGLRERPDAIALTDGLTGACWTGAELMDAVKCLAGGLAARGFGAGATVAIVAPNMPEYFVAFHGVVWAGGTATTVNPAYTEREIRHQLLDAGADLLIAAPSCLAAAKAAAEGAGVKAIAVIDDAGDADGVIPLAGLMGDPMEEQAPVDLDRLPAALPYSSGTTGLPKGVMLSHRNLSTNVDQVLNALDISVGESTVGFLPFFHIYGLNVILSPYLAAGGHVVTMPRFDMDVFLRLVQDYGVEQIFVAPPVALGLAKHPSVDSYDLSRLKKVFSAAAPLGADVAAACAERVGAVVLQGYGMTELSPASHLMPAGRARAGSVGLTAVGTSCRIVDPESSEGLGVDESGELWIKGPQVMMGYLNNPQATAETIDPDGWLKTGDLCSFDADGYLYVHDRLKELIKFKGFQVAPAELEDILLSHPGIADAAVIGAPDAEAGELPTAFVASAPGAAPDPAEIMAFVAERVATYKQIRQVIFVEAVPKSASGKILRRELRATLNG